MPYLVIILSVLLFFAPQIHGQQFYSGLLPSVSVSYKWSDKIQQTVKIESAHEMYHSESPGIKYAYDQTDIQLFLQGSINPFIKIAGGYQYRIEGGNNNSHRFIQQAAILQRKAGYRLSHRFRTDQSIYVTDPVKLRLRYRLSAEFPLEGQSLDAGELYMITSGEPIYSLQNSESDLETRITGSLGYFLNNKSKLEMGLDYRLEKLLMETFRQKLWVKFGWFYAI